MSAAYLFSLSSFSFAFFLLLFFIFVFCCIDKILHILSFDALLI